MNILYNFNTTDASHPSFFEMFIQTQMMPSLKPALKYTLAVCSAPCDLGVGFIPTHFSSAQVLSQKFPRTEWTLKWADELFYGGLFVIERHYLKHYGPSSLPTSHSRNPLTFLDFPDGSFSENFYGLRRAPVTADGKAPPPTRAQKQASLFFLVIIPYLKDKLDQYYARRFGSGHVHDYGASSSYFVSREQANQPVRGVHFFYFLLLIHCCRGF